MSQALLYHIVMATRSVKIVWFYFPEWYNQVRILAGEQFLKTKNMQYIAYLWNGRTHDKYAMLSYVGEEELDAFKKRVKSCYPYTQGWYAEFSVFERI